MHFAPFAVRSHAHAWIAAAVFAVSSVGCATMHSNPGNCTSCPSSADSAYCGDPSSQQFGHSFLGQTFGGASCAANPSEPSLINTTPPCGSNAIPGQPCASGLEQCICDAPRELRKVTLPEYMIEPPDILLIEAVSHLRTENAPVEAGEALLVQVNRTIPYSLQDDPVSVQFKQINGLFVVGADGYLNLGPEYGKVLVVNQPLGVIQRRVEEHLQQILTNPQVQVTLPRPETNQLVSGQHLVRTDGTVGLGIYGSVFVTGMTLQQARVEVERHLSQFIHQPKVSLDVLAYNSKVYYVITDGGGAGEQVYRLPSTGNETVLDAISYVNGLPTVASKADIWLARPSAVTNGPDQLMPIDWNGIVQGAQTTTNYQVFPGDRIYVKADKMIAMDTALAKITAPFERIFGFVILGNGTVRTLQRGRNALGGGL